MQRLRDQVRAWASDPTIHSVQLLEDARHAIEYDMVRTFHHLGLQDASKLKGAQPPLLM